MSGGAAVNRDASGGVGPDVLRSMFVGGSRWLSERRRIVDDMNVFPVPDGDTGTNMAMTLEKMESGLTSVFGGVGELAQSAARSALLGARGNSGVIFSQIVKGMADSLDGRLTMGPMELARALETGADRAYQAVIRPVEGTMLTVIKEAATAALLESVSGNATVNGVLGAALDQARHTLARTPQMLDKLRQAGVVDAGGQGIVFFIEGMQQVLRGEFEPGPPRAETQSTEALRQLPFQYCTEVVVSTHQPSGADKLKEKLSKNTDSLLVVSEGAVAKIHVHTNDPGRVLTWALETGELLDVKIDNMALQHREIIRKSSDDAVAAAEAPNLSVVAVAAGEGLKEIFRSLGASAIVEGGQSMNPSTEELVEAVNSAPGRRVIILPNNDNVVMTAARAAELCDREVFVVPTHSVPQGFAAMLEFDTAADAAECVSGMTDAIAEVSVAEITRAVRDSVADGAEIKKGDFIAIIDGRIRAVAAAPETVVRRAVEMMAGKGCELISLYRGEDAEEPWARELADTLATDYPDIDFQLHPGGQPHYLLLISGE